MPATEKLSPARSFYSNKELLYLKKKKKLKKARPLQGTVA